MENRRTVYMRNDHKLLFFDKQKLINGFGCENQDARSKYAYLRELWKRGKIDADELSYIINDITS